MSTKQTDIVIIGGGVSGLALATLLGQAGLTIMVVDPHKPAQFEKTERTGRTVALMESSVNILKHTGIWDVLEPLSTPMEMMRIIDDSDGGKEPIEIEFPASDISMAQFSYNIPSGPLRAALFERTEELKNVTFIESAFSDYAVHDGGIVVKLENKKLIKAHLLVGADGRNSAVREFANIQTTMKKYDQSAITCLINHSHSHNNTSTEFHRAGGPMALVPLPGNQSSVVWVEKTETADALIRLKKQEFEQALQDKTNNILGGITLETGPECWPLCSVKAKAITSMRLALIAEAAHVMSPITAQGLNLSLRDVAALAESVIDSARLGLDIGAGSVLKAYEKRRRIDIETRVFGVDTMNKIVSTDLLGLKRLRRAGLQSLDTLSPLKTLAMHIGLAPQIDQSRLARGEAL
ncbi:MAG: FAD-dependent oxidoreductase [Alphaproteobacteria bacterium]